MPVIDLNKSGAEHFDNPDMVLQKEAFEKLNILIKSQIATLDFPTYVPPTGKELSYTRSHNGILIEGGRGSGKTTFLINALHYMHGETKGSTFNWFSEVSSKLQVLPPIDPTLIETKEHIIIVIISLIDAALDDPSNNSEADRTKVNEARRKMAEGLGLLDGIGKSQPYGDEWEDPEWIMSRGLRKARNGRSFEIKFQSFIYEALKVLERKAFVLSFDDVDTNFEHGRTILETIRKYLTSPQLILLISGDLELYGRLVRRNIYDTFGKSIMENDPNIIGQDKKYINAAVQELEEQYLLKIAPPQNRIPMISLGGIIQASTTDDVKVIPFGKIDQEPLLKWASLNIRRKIMDSMVNDKERLPDHPFLELISREHLRLVIGYLRAIGSSDSIHVCNEVFSVFETRLRLSGVDPLKLAYATHNETLLLVFNWFVKQDKPTTLARFGVPSDAGKAIILHCFALAMAKGMQGSPARCLKTLVTLNLPVSMMQRTAFSQADVRKAILEFIWNDASPELMEVAGRIGSIARFDTVEESSNSIGNLKASCFGSVGTKKKIESRSELMHRIFNLSSSLDLSKVKTVMELSKYINTEDNASSGYRWIKLLSEHQDISVLNTEKGVVWFPIDDLTDRCGLFGGLLDLLTYDRFNGRGETFRSVSAISLLAAISKILDEDNEPDLHSMVLTSIIPVFRPKADGVKAGRIEDDDELTDSDEVKDTDLQKDENSAEFKIFMKQIKNWKIYAQQYYYEGIGNRIAEISPSELARLAERIHDQLLSLDEKVPPSWKTGQILHRQITNILHALLVITSGSSGRLVSPKYSDRPLVEALRNTYSKDDNAFHPIAAIVLSCPLIWAFLNPEEISEVSGSSTVNLKDEVEKALLKYQESLSTEKVPFESTWLSPPVISIVIGRSKATPRRVKQKGFFDVLNVVPRYDSKTGAKK